MPRLPTMRVIGSHAISTRLPPFAGGAAAAGAVLTGGVMRLLLVCRGLGSPVRRYIGPALLCSPASPLYPVVSSGRECRHSGSLFIVALVKARSARTVRPYTATAVEESLAPGG